jgi:hypothetical protein
METIDVVPLDASSENVTTTVEVEPPKRARSRQPKQDGDVKPKRQTRKPKSPLPMESTPTSEMPEVTGTSSVSEVQEEPVPLDDPVPSPDVEEQSLPPAVESKPKKTHTQRTKVEEPPVEEPPVEELPVEEPPVEEPPADEVY